MTQNRENWIPVLYGDKYYVVDKITNKIMFDAQGYGMKTEEKCWNWIKNMQRQVGIVIEQQQPHSNPLF